MREPHRRSAQVRHALSRISLFYLHTRVLVRHTCLYLPSRSWSPFTDPGGMEDWVRVLRISTTLFSSYYSRPSVHCCRSDALEQSATRHYWLCVTDVILPETENFFVFYIISTTTFFLFSAPWGFYLGHLKNFWCTYLCMYVCIYVHIFSSQQCSSGITVLQHREHTVFLCHKTSERLSRAWSRGSVHHRRAKTAASPLCNKKLK